MAYKPNATITIDGVDYSGDAVNFVSIRYGRDNIWGQARPGYATIEILNDTNVDNGFDMNHPVVVKVENSTGTDVTVFTGVITSVVNKVVGSGSAATTAIQTITAVSSMAKMSRVQIHLSNYPKEFDDVRMTRIFTEAGVTVDTVDTPGVYEMEASPADPADAYTVASRYAQMAFGQIYDTPTNTIGYANEARRFVYARDNGYTVIPKSNILWRGIQSEKTLADIMNSIILNWRAGSVTQSDATSIATYGKVEANIAAELHNLVDAQFQADRYINLRAIPRTSLSSFQVELDSSAVSNTLRNTLIGCYMGMPIEIDNLPIPIKNTTYRGFVESYNLRFGREQMILDIKTSDFTYSVTPTRWQDVNAADTWNSVGATVQWDTYDD
jgi:Ni,Fe-hydrogenase III small subunit